MSSNELCGFTWIHLHREEMVRSHGSRHLGVHPPARPWTKRVLLILACILSGCMSEPPATGCDPAQRMCPARGGPTQRERGPATDRRAQWLQGIIRAP